jgi:hypothetical protein
MATLPPTEVGFYPSKEYLDKNWAPTTVPLDSLRALARSQAEAEYHGLLDKETTKYYLPSALTEGRFDDYGVNQVQLNYGSAPPSAIAPQIAKATDYDTQRAHLFDVVNKTPDSKRSALLASYNPTIDALYREAEKYKKTGYEDKAWAPGQSFNKLRAIADKLGLDDPTEEQINKGAKYGTYDPTHETAQFGEMTPEDYRRNASLKTLAVINKVQESGKTGLDAWKAYNGAGSEAERYKKRVSHAYDMMEHPANKDMWNAYQNMVKQYRLELKHGKN